MPKLHHQGDSFIVQKILFLHKILHFKLARGAWHPGQAFNACRIKLTYIRALTQDTALCCEVLEQSSRAYLPQVWFSLFHCKLQSLVFKTSLWKKKSVNQFPVTASLSHFSQCTVIYFTFPVFICSEISMSSSQVETLLIKH